MNVVVWNGPYKGLNGILDIKPKQDHAKLQIFDGSEAKYIDVCVSDCQQVKRSRKRQHASEDSKYVPLDDSRSSRLERRTNMSFIFKISNPLFVFFKVHHDMEQIHLHKGTIAILHGGVLDLAKKSQIFECSKSMFGNVCIGNAANNHMQGGGGVDGAISMAGGEELYQYRKQLPKNKQGDRCATGDAIVTIAGRINVDYIIHAVGPNFHHYYNDSKKIAYMLLYNAYWNMFTKAHAKNCFFIGVPLLSSGIFRAYESMTNILGIALLAATAFLKHYPMVIYFSAFGRSEFFELQQILYKNPDALLQDYYNYLRDDSLRSLYNHTLSTGSLLYFHAVGHHIAWQAASFTSND